MNNSYFGWLTQFSDTTKNNFPNDPHYIPMVLALPWGCFYRQETHVMIPGTTWQSQSEAHIPRVELTKGSWNSTTTASFFCFICQDREEIAVAHVSETLW